MENKALQCTARIKIPNHLAKILVFFLDAPIPPIHRELNATPPPPRHRATAWCEASADTPVAAMRCLSHLSAVSASGTAHTHPSRIPACLNSGAPPYAGRPVVHLSRWRGLPPPVDSEGRARYLRVTQAPWSSHGWHKRVCCRRSLRRNAIQGLTSDTRRVTSL